MEISPAKAFKAGFFACLILAAMYLALFILSLGSGGPGAANVNEFKISGSGDLQVRNDMEAASDFASAEDADVDYNSKYRWGDGKTTFESSFLIASASSDGKWKNAYRVKGSGAGHKVSFSATKISGNASFAGTITLDCTAASETNFDSVVAFDTRDGSATIEGRVYNSTAGRPATVSELSAVGAFLLEHHLNISQPAITPDNWLGLCGSLDRDMILGDDTKGIWIAPLNTSDYNYMYDPVTESIARVQNSTRGG